MSSTWVTPEQEMADAVATLEAAARRVADLVLADAHRGIASSALPALAISLVRAQEAASASAVSLVRRVHLTGDLPDGFRSTRRWLQVRGGLSVGAAGLMLARGEALETDYAATGRAWLAGEIGEGTVQAITKGLEKALLKLPADDRDHERELAEKRLLDTARVRGVTVEDIAGLAKQAQMKSDPDGVTQAEMDAYDDQYLSFIPVGAGVEVRGYFDHETWATVQTCLDQEIDERYRTGSLTGEEKSDEAGSHADRRRKLRRPHQMALALNALCARLLGAGAYGTHHKVRPHITLVATIEEMRGGLGGRLRVPGFENPVQVSTPALERFLCDSGVTPAVTDGAGCTDDPVARLRRAGDQVLWVGREHRTITVEQRRLLELRGGGCEFTDCAVDPSRCHGHHVHSWKDGGPSDLDNLVLICPQHHKAVHEGGWTMHPAGDDPRRSGYWEFRPPERRREP